MADAVVADGATAKAPRFATIMKHLGVNLLIAYVIPGLLFYLLLQTVGVWVALITALLWCYGTMIWRVITRRPASGLLWLTAVALTAKTIFSFIVGSTFIYFLQPAVNDGVVAVLFLLSLATARPIVARLAPDFYPLSAEVASRPRIRRLFSRLTLLWAVICLIKSGVTVWLLESMSLVNFVAVKSVVILLLVFAGIIISVEAARGVARTEGLLPT